MSRSVAIGVDIGGTRTKYGLVDIAIGRVQKSIVLPTATANSKVFLQQIGTVIQLLKQYAKDNNCEVVGIGFGIPGYINELAIIETTYGFLNFMENYQLKAIVEKEYCLPCLLDNDARIVSLGEALYGKGKNFSRVLTLTVGTGVGFGFVVNKKFTEALPLAHMGGHIKIMDDGEVCYCGKRGCLESLVSATGIIALAKQYKWSGELSAASIFEAALNKNTIAVTVVEKLISNMHTGIHNYVNLFAPDVIVIGGGIAKGLAPYVEKIKGQSYLAPYPGYSFELQISELQEEAGILGSAALFQSSISQTI